jgi:hypothetical protein
MGRLIGGSRRERLITAGTALAIVIAIVAVIVLITGGSDGGDSGSDATDQTAYPEEADRICVQSTQAVALVANRVSKSQDDPAAALALYARAVVELAAQWRSRLGSLDPPPERQDAANSLELALAKLKLKARQIAEQAEAGEDLRRLRSQLDAAGVRVAHAIDALGLDRCAKERLSLGRLETG